MWLYLHLMVASEFVNTPLFQVF